MALVQKPDSESLRKAVGLLVNGHPVSFPTDTVYAIGAPVNYLSCVQKVFEIKQRPLNHALPILMGETRDIEMVAQDISDTAWKLMEVFWPGALTLVFKKKPFVPDIVTGGQPTVAVRIAAHQVAIDIVKAVGIPIVGTSANLHGKPSPVTAQDVEAQIGDKLELIIDAGKTPGGVESTIIDMSTDRPRILRQGAVSRAALEKYLRIY